MARPTNIFLVRHGESEANADKSVYGRKPDWRIELTERGFEQASNAGERLSAILTSIQEAHGPQSLGVYVSPYCRAVQTCDEILGELGNNDKLKSVPYFVKQDPRLRELERGNPSVRDGNASDYRVTERERHQQGALFYRIDGGESGANVYDRVISFEETRQRMSERADYPSNIMIVGHSFTMRVHLMALLDLSVESFHHLRDPQNAEIIHLTDDGSGGYRIVAA